MSANEIVLYEDRDISVAMDLTTGEIRETKKGASNGQETGAGGCSDKNARTSAKRHR